MQQPAPAPGLDILPALWEAATACYGALALLAERLGAHYQAPETAVEAGQRGDSAAYAQELLKQALMGAEVAHFMLATRGCGVMGTLADAAVGRVSESVQLYLDNLLPNPMERWACAVAFGPLNLLGAALPGVLQPGRAPQLVQALTQLVDVQVGLAALLAACCAVLGTACPACLHARCGACCHSCPRPGSQLAICPHWPFILRRAACCAGRCSLWMSLSRAH